jgi:predicted ATP-dependent endonuclease of OLD family
MHISKLSLVHYRNFANSKFLFNKGTNTIIGENGSGKTNLFRAIRLLLDDNLIRSAYKLEERDFFRGIGDWRGHWIIISLEFEEVSPEEAIQSLFLQEKAVLQDGHVFLVACPGSGKTRTLTYKAAYELSRLTSSKQYVVAITYTHRAADEIKERIEALGVDTEQLWIGTIHSFCLEWILKPYFIYHPTLKSGFTILGAHESEEILTRLCGPYRNPRVLARTCT